MKLKRIEDEELLAVYRNLPDLDDDVEMAMEGGRRATQAQVEADQKVLDTLGKLFNEELEKAVADKIDELVKVARLEVAREIFEEVEDKLGVEERRKTLVIYGDGNWWQALKKKYGGEK